MSTNPANEQGESLAENPMCWSPAVSRWAY